MAESLPIKFEEHMQLPALGINQACISFNNLTFESDKFICVRDTTGPQGQVVVVDLGDSSNLMRRNITADSAIMNPVSRIIALKAGRQLQVFNLELKAKVKGHVMNEDVVYWHWYSQFDLAIVTDTAVYHWSIEGAAGPVKVFDRLSQLAGHQIISYRVNAAANWMVLIGITMVDGRVVGNMQLFNKARGASQHIQGHAAAFAEVTLEGASQPTSLFVFSVRTETAARLHVVEIDHKEGNPAYPKKAVEIFFPPEAVNDFPVAMQVGKRYGIAYVVTKYGFIHLFDLETGVCVFSNRISGDTIFVTAEHESTSGILSINRKGQVLSVAINDDAIVPYILQTINNVELAFKLAARANLPGADDLYLRRFQQLMATSNYSEAARVAATAPQGILRTPQTIEAFKQVPATAGQLTPILQYFGLLLEKGGLNRHESIELARPVLAQNRKQLLEKWLKDDKLECSEELGDLVRPHDRALALSVYLRSSVPGKVVACLAELGQYDKVLLYSKQVGYTPDYLSLLFHVSASDAEKGRELATQLVNNPEGPLITVEQAYNTLMRNNLIPQTTAFLLDALKDNRPEHASLQTKLLELNLLHAPQVADAILSNEALTHFDRRHIAGLCEKAGLSQRALELYSESSDIKRVIAQNASNLPAEWLVTYFGRLSVDQSLELLKEMLSPRNVRQYLQVVVQVATKYSDQLGALQLVQLFESAGSSEGLYYFLASIVNVTDDAAVVLKYIQAACRIGQMREVERVCRENNVFDPEKVKNFLKEARLEDQLPLIVVCDRFNYVHDLILYLYQNSMTKFIEVYVQRVNPERTPQVIGALLDVGCDESVIRNLLSLVENAGSFPIDQLVDEVEKRNRLKLLHRWLEGRMAANSQDQAVYNALAKIYIDSNFNAERFLTENKLYDHRVVGKYCEKRDPSLAFIAYQQGQCDMELLQLTNDNAMFKQQARYLMKRRDQQLWTNALDAENPNRGSVVDQVISAALPEATDPEEVSIAVRAFMGAELFGDLIELLEKVVLENPIFGEYKSLQNLLLMTAIRHDSSRVMGYLERLSNYDAAEIASLAVANGLTEEALTIYRKNDAHTEAIGVLIDHIGDLERAQEFAERVDEPETWSRLAKTQLDNLRIQDAIDSYIRANDPSNYIEVIGVTNRAAKFTELIPFLTMARKTVREPLVESELAFAYAQTNRLADLQDMLSEPNIVQVQLVGDRCFDMGLYSAARIFFTNVSNWGRLASTLVRLEDYGAAVDAARKANSVMVWKDVHSACIEQREFRLAQTCGLNIIVHADELESLVAVYESSGLVEEAMKMLETGLGLERAHMGMFTELAILYVKYRPESIMDHLKLYWSRINIPKVIRACELAHLWPELVFLYVHYDEFDSAATTIMEHAADAFEHAAFKDIIVKVASVDLFYKALRFYLNEQPLLINDLLAALTPRIDHTRVVQMFVKSDNLPLIKPYLISVQSTANNKAVNEALHDLLIEEEDYTGLRTSVDSQTNFDSIGLAQRLEKHDMVEFRRVAAHLYKKNLRWRQSLALSKRDKLYKDAMTTAAESKSTETAEDLLRFFATGKSDKDSADAAEPSKECFAACLFTCYDLIRPDVVLELAWRNGWMDYAMPFMIQSMREQTSKIASLEKQMAELTTKVNASEKQANETPIIQPGAFGNQLMITAPGFAPTSF